MSTKPVPRAIPTTSLDELLKLASYRSWSHLSKIRQIDAAVKRELQAVNYILIVRKTRTKLRLACYCPFVSYCNLLIAVLYCLGR
jgi:hypothetical protein